MGKSITDLSSVTTVGLDLAKLVFQVHGVDASGRVVVAKAIAQQAVGVFRFAAPLSCRARSLRVGAMGAHYIGDYHDMAGLRCRIVGASTRSAPTTGKSRSPC
jgi:hypothetical protein